MNFNSENYKDRLEKRENRKNKVIEYVKKQIEYGCYPSYRDLVRKFNIGFWRINLKDIYPELGVDFLNIPFKRPNNCAEDVRKELMNYVVNEVGKNHYPSFSYIQSKFHLNICPDLFTSIEELYKKAGVEYKMKNSQEIKNRKAKILTNIVVSILPNLGLKLMKVRNTSDRGVDILAKNCNNENVGIEIKAINKFEIIKERHFRQLARFVQNEKLDRIILVTTTTRIKNPDTYMPNLEIIDYDKLKQLVDQGLFNDLEYIRNQPIHINTDEKEIKKKIIIEFVQQMHREGKKINHIVIRKNLGLFANTYFGNMLNLYKAAEIPLPIRKVHFYKEINKQEHIEEFITRILAYMKEEIAKGNKPRYPDINNKFKTFIHRYTSMRKLYTRLELPTNYGYKYSKINKRLRSMKF